MRQEDGTNDEMINSMKKLDVWIGEKEKQNKSTRHHSVDHIKNFNKNSRDCFLTYSTEQRIVG